MLLAVRSYFGFLLKISGGVLTGLFILALLIVDPAPSGASGDFAANYDISYKGFRVGRAFLSGSAGASSYDLDVNIEEAGLVSFFTSISGQISSQGKLIRNNQQPSRYKIDITYNKKNYAGDMRFNGNRVSRLSLDPEPEIKDDRVTIKPTDVRGALDPLSAIIIPRKARGVLVKSECDQRITVYEGRYLVDIVFRYDGHEKTAAKTGLIRDSLRCVGYLVYRAGHKKDGPNRTKDVMTVWLSGTSNRDILLPLKMEIQLKSGVIGFDAFYFK